MVYGLDGAAAIARVCYHAQELSLLTAQGFVDVVEISLVKADLDRAFADLTNPTREKHEPN